MSEETHFDHYANSADVLDEVMPIACYEEQISLRAAHLRGGAGPCGVDGTMLKEWLLVTRLALSASKRKWPIGSCG